MIVSKAGLSWMITTVAVGLPHDDPGGLNKAAVTSFGLPEGVLGPLAIADVASHHQSDRLWLGVDPAHAEVDRQGGACRSPEEIPLARVKEPGLIERLGQPSPGRRSRC